MSSPAPSPDVTARLDAAGPGVVRLSITNVTGDDVWLARPRLEAARMEGDFFEFQPSLPEYLGIKVKRRGYAEAELIRLGVGQHVDVVVDLREMYRFDGLFGAARVRYSAIHPLTGGERLDGLVTSNWSELSIRGVVAPTTCCP